VFRLLGASFFRRRCAAVCRVHGYCNVSLIVDRATPASAPPSESTQMQKRIRRAPDLSARDDRKESRAAAKRAKLHYVDDSTAGIRREKHGRSFRYVGSSGRPITDRRILDRIRGLVIPPAWTDVWICSDPDGHLQVTGHDAKGRKQYRYHPRWREVRDENKYDRLISFAQALPRIRRRVARDLRRKRLPREKVLAAVIKLLETTLVRVGNDEYAEANKSFGLTTMRDRHARVTRGKVRMEFSGKSGVDHEIDVHDPRLVEIVRKCQELPGQELLQYVDEQGKVHDVGSSDVNEYLREISGDDFSAKDFRTWAGTALAAEALKEFEDFDTKTAAKRNVTRAIERVAERLGNTKAVCRKCYVHPAIVDAYMDRSLLETLKNRAESELRRGVARLPAEEAAVLALLQQRMKQALKHDAGRRAPRAR
jgi:DNA topoisomerase-1